MKLRNILLAAITVIAAASCAKEAVIAPEGEGLTIMRLTASSEASKAVIESFHTVWSAGDKLAVYDNVDTDAHVFTLTDGAGNISASFSGTVSTGTTSAWVASPAVAATAFANGVITMTMPDEQKASGKSCPDALLSTGKADGTNIQLKNVGALVCFQISDTDVKKVIFEGNNAEKIAGSVKVNAETGTIAEIVDAKTAVEFIPATGCFTPGTYYVALLPANFKSGITVTVVNDSDDIKVRSSGNPLNLARNNLIEIGDVCNGFCFADNVKSFNYGETLELSVNVSGITNIWVKSCPSYWGTDLSNISSGKITVTAPAKGLVPKGGLILSGFNSKGVMVSTNTLLLRQYGINDKDDLLAFREAHGATETQHTELVKDADAYAASIAPYKVGDWVTLNSNIYYISGDDFVNYGTNFMHHIHEPFDGDGHVITLQVDGKNTAAILSFFQHIDAPVKNIRFEGYMNQTAKDECVIATLAQQVSAAVTVENIDCRVDVTTDRAKCTIGGIIAKGAAAEATLRACNYYGTIKVDNSASYIGGVVGNHAIGKGEYALTIDNCDFMGKIEYTSMTHFANCRFGGIIGSQERNAVLTDCRAGGDMIFNVSCTKIATASGAGIGGIVGRCNAVTSGYTMSTTLKKCYFTGNIIFNSASSDQPKTYINKLVGSKLSGYQEAASTGNYEIGDITYNYPTAVARFTDPSAKTFDFNQTENLGITTEDAVGVSVKSAPKGWTVDCTDWKNGTVTVTAPDIEATDIDRAGFIVLEVEAAGGVKFAAENIQRVRMPGIYDAQDMIDFRAAYGNDTDLHTTLKPVGDISPYMIDGEIAITGDITIPNEGMYKGATTAAPYWMVTLVKPLNGNGHTLTFTTSHTTRGALIQDVMANVHDLNLAGSIDCSGTAAMIGGLCCYISNDNLTISNVKSSVTVIYSGTGNSYIGGLVASQRKYGSTAVKYTMNNCSFDGSISVASAAKAAGGIVGLGAIGMKGYLNNCSCTGKITVSAGLTDAVGGIYGVSGSSTNPGEIVYLNNCSFGGTITYKNPEVSGNARIGGIIGDLARGAELTGCTSTGNINVNMNGIAFTSAGGRGIGGVVGRTTAPSATYPNMNAYSKLVDNSFTGKITVTNSIDTAAQDAAGIGQIIGRRVNTTTAEESGSVSGGTVNITKK